MHLHHTRKTQGLIRQPALCTWLDLTRSGLDKLRKKDKTFPTPIKDGDTRQAAAYYVVAEVEAWLGRRIAARDAATAAVAHSKRQLDKSGIYQSEVES